MVRHNYNQMARAILGHRLDIRIDLLTRTADAIQGAISDWLNNPKAVERELDERATAFLERRRELNRLLTERAADDGEELAEQRSRLGTRTGWYALLRKQRISPRTAQNRIALHVFRDRLPHLFKRFAALGVTRCTRLATLEPRHLEKIQLDTMVQVGDRKIPVEHLSDDQLLDYLRTVAPPKERPRRKRLDSALRTAERAASHKLDAAEPLDRETVERSRDAAQRITHRLNELLRTL
jgi:hypothetical protein